MRIPPCVYTVTGLLLLAGCDVEVPKVSSGYSARGWTSPASSNHVPLSPPQITALSSWLADRSGGWTFAVTDYAPETSICLEHPGKKPSWIYLTKDRIWVRNWYRLITPAEYTAIMSILDQA